MINISPALYFTIDNIPSHTPGWRCINTLELAKPAPKRGTQARVLPGASGGRPQVLRDNWVERTINFHVYGRYDSNGTINASEIDGLQTNLDYLAAQWAAVPVTSDSTRTCVLHRLGATKSASVQVLDMDWDYEEMPVAATLLLRLLLPTGSLA